MPYKFEKGRIYRMPTHFGPAPGPRALPADLPADPSRSPRKTLISASFYTEASALDRHIPPRFSLYGDPLVTVEFHFMTEIDWLAGRGYTMIHVWWPVIFEGAEEKVSGRFLAVMWENLADPIITGRCEVGQPKLFADIPDLQARNGMFKSSASWMGFEFLSLEGSAADKAQSDNDLPHLDGTLMLKYVPRTGDWGGSDLCQVSFSPNANPNLVVESKQPLYGTVFFRKATWRDLPTMCHVVNALADLPQRGWGPASISRMRGGKSYLDQRILD